MDLIAAAVGIVAILAVVWLTAIVFLWLHRPSRALAADALRLIPDVARLAGRLLRDGSTPLSARVALALLLAYLVLPIDLVPDFIPGLGQVDDVVVAALVLRWVGRRVGRQRLQDQWPGTPQSFALVMRLLGWEALPRP